MNDAQRAAGQGSQVALGGCGRARNLGTALRSQAPYWPPALQGALGYPASKYPASHRDDGSHIDLHGRVAGGKRSSEAMGDPRGAWPISACSRP